jgi:hypothetical protein
VVGFYLITEFLAKDFEKMRFRADGPQGPGGRSARTRRTVREVPRTVRYLQQNEVLLGVQGGRSAASPRTVRVAQADGPPSPTRSHLSR